MSAERRVLDVSHLPTVTFGPKNITWWGTLGFMVIEGVTLAVAIAAYFYLRQNALIWPPEPTRLPSLGAPMLNLLLLLIVIWPMRRADQAARHLDRSGAVRWLLVAVAFTAASNVARAFEFQALNTRWDHHAYGSIAWTLLGLHTALLVVDLLETGLFALLMFLGPVEKKHYADVSDAAFYQYFLSLSYVVVFLVLFVSPRLI